MNQTVTRLLTEAKMNEIMAHLGRVDGVARLLAEGSAPDTNVTEELKRCADAIYRIVNDLPTN